MPFKVLATSTQQILVMTPGALEGRVYGVSKGIFTIAAEFHALIGYFLLSICRQTHEFEIHVTRQRARAGNSTICHCKKHIDVSF